MSILEGAGEVGVLFGHVSATTVSVPARPGLTFGPYLLVGFMFTAQLAIVDEE